MLEINGYKFAEKESEIVDSLFHEGGTVSGTVKRFKRKIMFYDIQGNPFAVVSQENVSGTVSKLDNGKLWYSYATPYFLKNLPYAACHALTEALSIANDSKGLVFR